MTTIGPVLIKECTQRANQKNSVLKLITGKDMAVITRIATILYLEHRHNNDTQRDLVHQLHHIVESALE